MTHATVPHSRRWPRFRQYWLTGFLLGCLLPVTLGQAVGSLPWEELPASSVQVALIAAAHSLHRQRLQWRNGNRRRLRCGYLRRFRILRQRLLKVQFAAGIDVLSRRGPPAWLATR